MEGIRTAISDRIQAATARRIQQYDALKGKQVKEFPFWDIVVIGSMDKTQKVAYELQIHDKLSKDQLPLGVDYCVVADPGTEKIGGGGSLLAILQCLKQAYQEELTSKKVLIIPAGGYSQRLPSASLLGKMFLSVPLGDPLYQVFDLKLVTYIDLPAKMPAGIFLAASDCIELYADDCSLDWSFNPSGVTALGHPSPVSIGIGHGVFVVPEREANSTVVEVVPVLEFLHKPSIETMHEREAILSQEFCSGIGTEGEMVLTDSSYYMDFDTALKLVELYDDESPLRCEIDCHGDILQPLGPRASNEYIKNTSNISTVTQSLIGMRQKIFDILQGTKFSVAVMQESRFYHIGTTNEYLNHMCNQTSIAKEMGFKVSLPKNSADKPQAKASEKHSRSVCIMNSICPDNIKIEDHCVVEHCEFKKPVTVQRNSIISSCSVGPSMDENLTIILPQDTFLYTACVFDGKSKKQYVTVAFGIKDNMKETTIFEKLSFFGKFFKDLFGVGLDQAESCIFPAGIKRSLWNAKLFQPAPTMEAAFSSTSSLLEKVQQAEPLQVSAGEWDSRVSMADLIKSKDIFDMLNFRQKLAQKLESTTS